MPALDFNTWAQQSGMAPQWKDQYESLQNPQSQQMYQNYLSGYDNAVDTGLPGGQPGMPVPDPFGGMKQAGLYGANQALAAYGQGPINKSFGDMSQGSFDAINNFNNQGYTQAGMNYAQGMMGARNPNAFNINGDTSQFQIQNPYQRNRYAQGFGDYQTSNPFQKGFKNFQKQQNKALDATVDRAMDKVQNRVNSQFELGGRTGSVAHSGNMTENLGSLANQMYSDNYQQNMGRALQAQGMGADTYAQDQARGLQAQGMMANTFAQDQNRGMQGMGHNLNAFQQGFGNQFNQNQANANMWNQDQQMGLQAAGMLPGMQNSQLAGITMQNQFGQQQDDQNFYNDSGAWNNLNNYSSIIAAMNGTQPPDRPEASNFDRALGLLGLFV